MILIPVGFIITAIVYFLGFLGVVAVLEQITKETCKLLPFLNNFNISIYLQIILVCSIILAISLNSSVVKTKNNEKYFRKPWQNILEICCLILICVFLFNKGFNHFILGSKSLTLIFFIALSVSYIVAFSHFCKSYISNTFDYICHKSVTIIKYFSYGYIVLSLLFIYFMLVYLHDIVLLKNMVLSVLYFGILLILTLIFSGLSYHELLKFGKSEKSALLYFIGGLLVIGVPPVYNSFINNKDLYSIYTLLTINIGILFVLGVLNLISFFFRRKT